MCEVCAADHIAPSPLQNTLPNVQLPTLFACTLKSSPALSIQNKTHNDRDMWCVQETASLLQLQDKLLGVRLAQAIVSLQRQQRLSPSFRRRRRRLVNRFAGNRGSAQDEQTPSKLIQRMNDELVKQTQAWKTQQKAITELRVGTFLKRRRPLACSCSRSLGATHTPTHT
jgi:hypothetical protein